MAYKLISIFCATMLFFSFESDAQINLNYVKPGDIIEFNKDTQLAAFNSANIVRAKENCPFGQIASPNDILGNKCVPIILQGPGKQFRVTKINEPRCYDSENQGAGEVCEISLRLEPVNGKKIYTHLLYYTHNYAELGYPSSSDFKIVRAAPRNNEEKCNLFLQRIYAEFRVESFDLIGRTEIMKLSESRRYTLGPYNYDECKGNLAQIKPLLLKQKPLKKGFRKLIFEINGYFYNPDSIEQNQTVR